MAEELNAIQLNEVSLGVWFIGYLEQAEVTSPIDWRAVGESTKRSKKIREKDKEKWREL